MISENCRLATTPDTLDEVFRLRYAGYRRKGSIEANPDERFRDHFDETPNHFSFLARDAEGQAMATVRISVVRPDLGWSDSPARHVYGDHPAFQSVAKDSFVEASRLVFGPQARRDSFVGILGNMAALAEFYEVEWLVACPRVEHAEVYQNMFGFTPLAEPRQYFGVAFQTQLLGITTAQLGEYVRGKRAMRNAWTSALAYLQNALAVEGRHGFDHAFQVAA